jgi:NAD(P)-dependent dehydrogenase (short-subunit alcohol dehydrogenase family)
MEDAMSRLKGKSALVLGAASVDNMGQIIAKRFADEGAQVTVAGRNMANLQSLADAIGGSAVHCDITSKADIDAAVAHAVDCSGPIDIAVNCTGWGLLTPFEDTSEEDLVAMMNLQFKGPYQFMQALVTNMSDSASIIQISSATATILVGDHHAYIGTKAGIDHVIRGVADEFGARGIRANSISPGFTQSPMTDHYFAVPGLAEAFIKEYPMGRLNTSQDIAAAAVFLGSDECFMTGQNLQVNGGLTLRRNPMPAEIEASTIAAAQADSTE